MNSPTRCLLIFPKFLGDSFWNYRTTCELLGARYPAAPLGLTTVAALLPQDWDIRLLDRNVEELGEKDVEWADLVLVGGMLPQQIDAVALIDRLVAKGKTVVVGGPDATTSAHLYDRAQHLVLGEAEVTLPRFLADFAVGRAKHIYDSGEEMADVALSPIPRFDLLHFEHYLHVGIQFARGCPFRCEFCDIIERFGRVPRLKTDEQVLAELQRLYDLGYRGHIDFVDDNFIGNKKIVKRLLPRMHEWLVQHDWPFEFSTEVSINIAEDEELLGLMQEVGFSAVFVGIETPDRDSLLAAQKTQNLRRPIGESIHTLYRYGIFANAGYIVGFDSETGSVADAILANIEDTAIPASMVGLLFALPRTQLARRLKAEGRLPDNFDVVADRHIGCQCTGGLNFETKRPRGEILADYRRIVAEAYEPKRYFDRVLRVGLELNASKKRLQLPLIKRAKELAGFGRFVRAIGLRGPLRGHFWRVLLTVARKNPGAVRYVVVLMALYMHFGEFRDYVLARVDDEIAEDKRATANAAGSNKLRPASKPVEAAPAF